MDDCSISTYFIELYFDIKVKQNENIDQMPEIQFK